MHKKYSFLTLFLFSFVFHYSLNSASFDEQEWQLVESEAEKADQNWQQYFLESPDHNPLISKEVRQKLIDKGYSIIQKLNSDEVFENKVEIFENAGRHFVEEGWLQQVPTLKSIKNSFSTLSSFFLGSSEDDKEQSKATLTDERRAHLESIICIAWALADHAARLKYCQPNLVFTIQDGNKALWDAIDSYAQRCKNSSQGYESYFAATPATLQQPFHHQKESLEAWTIDARFESTSWALPLLPYKNNCITFIKLLDADGSADKIGCYLHYKNESIAAWLPTLNKNNISEHQETRTILLTSHVTTMRDYITLEGFHENTELLKSYPKNKKEVVSDGIKKIHKTKQPLDIGELAYCAAYIFETEEYSLECKEAAKNLLLFLKNSCGDPIKQTEQGFVLDPLVVYRLFDEVVLDLAQLPLKKEIAIEILEKAPIETSQDLSETPKDEKENKEKEKSKEAQAPLSNKIIQKLFNALEKQKVAKVTTMLEENPALVNTVNEIDVTSDLYGRTPLHHAVFKHNLELVTLLVKQGANLEARDKIGRTPLYIAYQFTKEPIMKFLIKSEANVNACANNGDSVIQTALRRVDFKNLDYFLNHGGSLKAHKQQTLRIFNLLIRTAHIRPNKESLPRDKEIYKAHIQILTMPQVQDFLGENLKFFSQKYQTFLKDLYKKKEKTKK